METLTQEQLNAGIVIDALARLAAVNTNPQYGFGADTFKLVKSHVNTWDSRTKREVVDAIKRIFNVELIEEPRTAKGSLD